MFLAFERSLFTSLYKVESVLLYNYYFLLMKFDEEISELRKTLIINSDFNF